MTSDQLDQLTGQPSRRARLDAWRIRRRARAAARRQRAGVAVLGTLGRARGVQRAGQRIAAVFLLAGLCLGYALATALRSGATTTAY